MADLATIINLPRGTSEYATVKDQFGNLITVSKKDLPPEPVEGNQYAYRVEFSNGGKGQWTVVPKQS